MSYGLDSPFQANLVGGRTNQVGSLSNSPGERSAPNNRMYSRFAAQAASGSSNSTVYSPSYNQSFNSLYYSPGTSIGLPRSASAMKQQIKGNQTMHLRTAISYSPTITGLHPGDSGFATSTIRGMTAFGSGFDIQKFLGWAYANPVGQGLSEMLIYGKPEFKTKRREFELGTYALLGGWARGGPLGAAVALGATSAAIYGGYKLNEAIQGGPDRHKRGYGTELLSFMSYGAVSGGLFAGTESGLLKGTLGGNLARQAYDLVSKQATKISHGHFNMPSGPMEGLEPGLEDWVNPFRRFKQGSIVEQAEFFHDPKIFGWRLPVPGLSKENAIKFSEAYHGYSAFVLREAATFGGVKNIPRGNYYKALAKDVGIGALGGLYEGTILGAAYIGLHWLGHKLFGHKKDNKIDGLHPGNQGFATQAIRQYTSFGSEHDPFKAINMGKFIYSGNATRQRQWANRALSIINKPDANIIGFDTETGGLLSQLEPGVKTGAQRSSIFEFAIKSNKKETYGFTTYASAEAYANSVNQGGDFSEQFGLAMERYKQYHGKPYSATDIVSEIGSHIIPGKTNILLGHNINWFDLKMLSADYAIEQGFISKKDITRFHELGMGPKTNGEEYNRLQQVVTEGWGKANNAILKSWALKRGNLKIIDTLGTPRVSKYIVPMRSTQEGLVRNILGGYYPGIRQHWYQRELNKNIMAEGMDPGMAAEIAAHQAQFPSMVGSGLEDISAFFGRKFTGPAHHPMADISNTIEFVKSKGLRSRLKAMDLAINNKAERFINREHVRYLANQRMIAERTLSNGSAKPGKLSLANDIIEGTSGLASPTTNTFKTGLNKWWGELPAKSKIGYGILGAATAYMGLKALFGSRTRYTDDQPQVPSGMHYGNRGYATQIIRSQTDFGSGWRGIISTNAQLFKNIFGSNIGGVTAHNAYGQAMSIFNHRKDLLGKNIKWWWKPFSTKPKYNYKNIRDLIKEIHQSQKAGLESIIILPQSSASSRLLKNKIAHERFHMYSNKVHNNNVYPSTPLLSGVTPSIVNKLAKIYHPNMFNEEYLAYTAGAKRYYHKGFMGMTGYDVMDTGILSRDLSALKEIDLITKTAKTIWKSEGKTSFGAKIDGLHPGNNGYATQIIRSQTDFGSPVDLVKALFRSSKSLQKEVIPHEVWHNIKPMNVPLWMQKRIDKRIINIGASHGPTKRISLDYMREPHNTVTSLAIRPTSAIAKIPALHPGDSGYATSQIRSTSDFGSGLNIPKVLKRAYNFISGDLAVEETIEKHTILKEYTNTEIKYLADRFVNKNKFKDFMLRDSDYKVKLKPTNGLVNGVLDQNAIAHDRAMSRMPINI